MSRAGFGIGNRLRRGQGGRDAAWDERPVGGLADDADRGFVVEGRDRRACGQGQTPERVDATFDASRHVVLHGSSTRTTIAIDADPRHPSASTARCFLAGRALPDLGAAEANHLRLASRLALTELMLSGAPPPPTIIISIRTASRTRSTSRSRRRARLACA